MYDLFMKNVIKNKIYQMFILGLEGISLENNKNLSSALKSGLGGVIFFTQNIKTSNQFKTLIDDIKSIATIPPFLSIDQEGGRVERTENIHGGKKYLSGGKFISEFGLQNAEKFLKQQTVEISNELKSYGINLNFAPCIDVNTNPENPIIGERAFSNDVDDVIKFGKIVVDTYLENGIIPCVKHFPGHGDASVDSHKDLPQINLTMEEMEKYHIKPFKEAIKWNVPMIMAAHLYLPAFDENKIPSSKIPSSLSENIIRKYLIEKLNYKGLIITDDMVMGGISNYFLSTSPLTAHSSPTKACAMAIKAGVNILLYRDSFDETIKIIENLAKLAEDDEILRKNIENSYKKIIQSKQNLKLIT